jgi:hypothetical protein
MPVDPASWPNRTQSLGQQRTAREVQRKECHTFLNQDASSDEANRIASHINTASEYSDYEPQIKLPRFEKSGRVNPMSGIVFTMTMAKFTIDRDVRHFITDMDENLACFQHGIDDSQKGYLVLAAVKVDAKDIFLSYTVGQLDSVTEVFKVMLKAFRKREKCVAGLHQLKQDTNEKISEVASSIPRYVREMGVNAQKFDKICIHYLKIGFLPKIQCRLNQRNPLNF